MRMSDMKYGIRSYFSALLKGKIISPATMPQDLVETMYIKETYDNIQKAETPCVAVRELMNTDYPEPMKTFFSETGKRYAVTGVPGDCKRLLTDYLYWLESKIGKPSLPDIPSLPSLPELPSLPSLPSLTPDVSGIKRSLQVTGLVIIGVILLVVYMLTGRGGKKGGVTVVT